MKKALLIGFVLASGPLCYGQRQLPVLSRGTPVDGIRLDLSRAEFTAEGAEVALPEFQAEHSATDEERDGRWVLSVRLSSPGAAGLQLLIEDLRLPTGAKLVLSEARAAGEPSTVRAVYEGSGPLGGGAFWSDAVPGSDAVLEVIYEGEQVSSLPFRLTAVRHLTAAGLEKFLQHTWIPEEPVRQDLEGTTGTAMFRGVEVPYVVRNGWAIFEGDIVLGPVEELELPSPKAKSAREAVGITNTNYRWPGGVIPYTIDANLPSQSRITNAIAHWNNSLGGALTLVPWSGQAYYVRFAYTTSSSTCSSYVGMVRIAGQRITIGNYCSTGSVIHEIGHAVGLYHEHTREDRNSYVRILWENVSSTATYNFTQNITNADDISSYDYGSIMHYGATSFSANGKPTIETIPAGIPIGQRSGLSSGDVNGARSMYASSTATSPPPPSAPTPPSTVQVTLASSPSGRQLVVDGVTVTAPTAFQWTIGSVHTISAPNAASGYTRYLLSRWSDNGAQTHTITTSASATYTAYYTVRHRLTATSSNPSYGSVSVSPASADSYYNQGTSVTVYGTPYSPACLANWTGVSAPPSSPILVTVSQPYGIIGNFQVGAVTVSSTSFTFSRHASTASFSVTSSYGCNWTAHTNASWIQIVSGAGTSSGKVTFSISANTSRSVRQAIITVNGVSVLITQRG